MSSLPPTSDDHAIWDLWLSVYRLPALTAADELGVFAALSAHALTSEALAQQLGVDARALQILLGVLAALGFVERRELRWRATAVARTWLHPEGEGYYGPFLLGYRQSQPLHGQLLAAIRPGSKQSHSTSVPEWERGTMPPDVARRITAFMNSHSTAAARAVARMPELADVRSLLDVGGGSGVFCIELAKAWPQLRATVMEIDVVCDAARPYIEAAGVAARVTTQAVNMFSQEWPRGHDALFFSNIFHDWSDETCRLLARRACDALQSGGRVLLHEMLMDDDGCGPLPAATFSLLMLLGTKGRQYTLPELRDFLHGAGFVDVQASRTGGGYYSLVTARKL